MSDIIATEKGIYDLHTVDGCYRYLGESGLGSRELAALERIYKSALTTPATVPSEPGRYRMSVDVDVLQGPFTGDLWVTCNKKMAVLANLKYFTQYGATFTKEPE